MNKVNGPGQQPASDLPPKLARLALSGAGYWQLVQLTGLSEAELLQLHGMGSRALGQFREALAERGLTFGSGEARMVGGRRRGESNP